MRATLRRWIIWATASAALGLGCAASDATGPTVPQSGSGGAGGALSTPGSGGVSGSGGDSTTSSTGGATGPGSGGSGGAPIPEAGAPDAPPADGMVTGGAGCAGITSKFCDDFEQQTAGVAPTGMFTVGGKAGALVVDTTKAFSGTKAVHIVSAKPAPGAMLQFSKQFPTNDLHGRAMFFVTRVPSGSHWDLVYSYSQNNVQWELGGMYGKFMFTVDPPDHGITSIAFPTGKWFCVQWQFKYGGTGASNTFVAKMDGKVLDKGQFTGADPTGQAWNGGPWRNVNVGWATYGSSDVDVEMWVDDVA
ncbi:MAG TPA: hypothetical protein VNO55_25455, partial [Polyangia bacterium]|nr:hypothetical protein [Polyangia bacterium]